jgi:hypothetical protein
METIMCLEENLDYFSSTLGSILNTGSHLIELTQIRTEELISMNLWQLKTSLKGGELI